MNGSRRRTPPRPLILGVALLLALAVSLAPRTPPAFAQPAAPGVALAPLHPTAATPPAPAVAPNAPTTPATEAAPATGPSAAVQTPVEPKANKGLKATIEIDTSDAADRTLDSTAGASGKHEITVTKDGRRVRLSGIGKADREYDSPSAFMNHEPAIARAVVAIVAIVFLSPVLIVVLVIWYRIRKARMLNETMLKLAERGVVPPVEAMQALGAGDAAPFGVESHAGTASPVQQAQQIRRRAASSGDLRKCVIIGAVGLGLTLFSLLDDGSPNSVGLILLFMGIGYGVLWWLETRHAAERPADPKGGA